MKPWQFAVVSLALLATTGCRSDPAVPILERELRRKEDEIYRLRASLDEFQDCGSCQNAAAGTPKPGAAAEPNATPRRQLDSDAGNGNKPPAVEMPGQPSSGIPDALKSPTPSGTSLPGIPDVPENLRGPSKPVSPPDTKPGLPATKLPTSRTTTPAPLDSEGPSLGKGTGGVSSRSGHFNLASLSDSAVPLTPSGDSRQVASIALNRSLTGSIVADDRSGDQGLLVVIEPRDRAGRPVDAPAEVNVVVVDPALKDPKGQASRVARWDFTAAEAAAMFRRSGSSQAMHLMTAWPGDPPVHNKLHLFVRYVTADGRKLETDQPIEVALPGDPANRWTAGAVRTERSSGGEAPAARPSDASPSTAARSDELKSQRPVWSPDRR
jgi:hypothetical protein